MVAFYLFCRWRATRSGRSRAIPNRRGSASTSMSGVYPVRGDITTYSVNQLAELMKKQDAVVHLAGIIIEKGTPGFETVHTEGTRRMMPPPPSRRG